MHLYKIIQVYMLFIHVYNCISMHSTSVRTFIQAFLHSMLAAFDMQIGRQERTGSNCFYNAFTFNLPFTQQRCQFNEAAIKVEISRY